MPMIGAGAVQSRRSTCGRRSGLIDAQARRFLIDTFTALRDDLTEQEQEGGPGSPDAEKARREVAIYQALLDALEGRGPFPDDAETRRLIHRLAKAADDRNNYKQAALEHRGFRELLGSLPTP